MVIKFTTVIANNFVSIFTYMSVSHTVSVLRMSGLIQYDNMKMTFSGKGNVHIDTDFVSTESTFVKVDIHTPTSVRSVVKAGDFQS